MKEDMRGRLIPCPECEHPTGVPLPSDATVVETEGDADGSTLARCPDCGTAFTVRYSLVSEE